MAVFNKPPFFWKQNSVFCSNRYMITINSDNAVHDFNFVPKGNDPYSAKITHVLTRDEYTYNKSKIFKNKYFYTLKNASLTCTNNDRFLFEIFDRNNDLIFQDHIFCTDQIVGDYTINKDVYTQRVTENKFILNEQ